jgi:methyltransferase-like protein
MIREMMLFHTRGFSDPQERVHQSIALVKFLAESQTKTEGYRQFLQDELEMLLRRDENNIFHDELGELNTPFLFHHFCEDARRHGLQYLAEGDYVQMRDHNFAPSVREALRQLGKNRVAREQYLDFISFRRFRQTLLCHADLPLRFGMTPETAGRIHVACMARPVSANPDLRSEAAEKFVGDKNANMEVNLPLAKAALMVLSEIWPRSMKFTALLAQSRARLGRPPGDASVNDEALPLFELFLQIYAPGLATLHASPPAFASAAGERPMANPLARWQARTSDRITSLTHCPVVLDNPTGRHLMTLLDGTRDRPALLRDTRSFLEASSSGGKPDSVTQPLPGDQELAANLNATLEVFARCALLLA